MNPSIIAAEKGDMHDNAGGEMLVNSPCLALSTRWVWSPKLAWEEGTPGP